MANKTLVKLEELEVAVAEMKRRLGDKEMDIDGLKQRDLERTKDINDLKAQIDKLSHEELKKGVKALRQKRKF
jgi:hypothetical protein